MVRWFVPHTATRGEVNDADALLKRIREKNSRRVDDGVEFAQHAELNGFKGLTRFSKDLPKALSLYFVGLHRYKNSTKSTRIRNVLWYLRRLDAEGTPLTAERHAEVTAGDILKEADWRAAGDEVKKAPYVPLERLLEFLERCESDKIRIRVLFMILTGLRNVDVNYLARDGFRINDKHLFISVSRAKNRRRPRHRVRLVLRKSISYWSCYKLMDRKRLLRAAQHGMEAVSLSELNRYLAGIGATSYSLRRLYIKRIIEMNRGYDGSVDWDRVALFTLHFSPATIRAYYEDLNFDEDEGEDLKAGIRHAHFLDDVIGNW